MGTLTNITQRHEAHSVRMPPATSPTAAPPMETAVYRPSARIRSRPSLNMVVSRARAEGAASAAPAPWTARAASSQVEVVAKPPTSDATVNSAMPAKNVRRRPSRSPARAPSSSRPPKVRAYALITHERLAVLKPRLAWILGRATFTMVASRTTMSWQTRMTASTNCGRDTREAGAWTGERVWIDIRRLQGYSWRRNGRFLR